MQRPKQVFDHNLSRQYLQCAWPNKLQARLQQLYPSARVVVRNMAQPAWSYSRWVEAGVIDTLVQTDVLIVDLQVNSLVRSVCAADGFSVGGPC